MLFLQSVLPRWVAVACAETVHINTDENAGCARCASPSLRPAGRSAPGVSIQTTEFGTVYQPTEVRAIADHVQSPGMVRHMDGARIS